MTHVANHALFQLPRRLMDIGTADGWERVSRILCDLDLVEAAVREGLVHELVRCFVEADRRVPDVVLLGPAWEEWLQFGETEAGHLARYGRDFPQLAFQQAFNQPSQGAVSSAAQARLAEGQERQGLWFERINRPWEFTRLACRKTLEGHAEGVRCLALTDDGRVLSGGKDGVVRVWDLDTGECLHVMEGHTSWVNALAVTDDGRAVSASEDKRLRVWDLGTGECLRVLEGHASTVRHVEVTRDRRVVSSSWDRTLRVWDLDTGECLRVLEGRKGSAEHFALLDDGRVLAPSGNLLRLWDLDTGECQREWWAHVQDPVTHVVLTGDGHAVTGGYHIAAHVWKPETGEHVRTFWGHKEHAWYVAADKDGRVVSASADETVCVWDPTRPSLPLVLKGHECLVWQVALTGDGRAVSASADHTLRVWDLATGECLKVLAGHTDSVGCVVVTGDGRAISGSNDGMLRVWDLDGECPKKPGYRARVPVQVELTGDGRAVTASQYNPSLRIWDLENAGNPKEWGSFCYWVEHFVLLEEGRLVAFCQDGTVRFWDLATGECVEVLAEDSDEAAEWRSRFPPTTCLSHLHCYGPTPVHHLLRDGDRPVAVYPGRFAPVAASLAERRAIYFQRTEAHVLHVHEGDGGR